VAAEAAIVGAASNGSGAADSNGGAGVGSKVGLVWLETPTNPTLKLADIAKVGMR
jgi:cystathionine beta-lyase/cystathionine gamma-synthase